MSKNERTREPRRAGPSKPAPPVNGGPKSTQPRPWELIYPELAGPEFRLTARECPCPA